MVLVFGTSYQRHRGLPPWPLTVTPSPLHHGRDQRGGGRDVRRDLCRSVAALGRAQQNRGGTGLQQPRSHSEEGDRNGTDRRAAPWLLGEVMKF